MAVRLRAWGGGSKKGLRKVRMTLYKKWVLARGNSSPWPRVCLKTNIVAPILQMTERPPGCLRICRCCCPSILALVLLLLSLAGWPPTVSSSYQLADGGDEAEGGKEERGEEEEDGEDNARELWPSPPQEDSGSVS